MIWIALGLGFMNLALWVLWLAVLLRAWKKIAPALAPMLSMFAAPPARGEPQTEPAAPSSVSRSPVTKGLEDIYIPPDNLL